MKPQSPSFLKKALRPLLFMAGTFLVLLLVGAFAADRVLSEKYVHALAHIQKQTTDNVGFFCEQQAVLAADPWFHEQRPQGDAGSYLNPLVRWEGLHPEVPKGSPLVLPAQLPRDSKEISGWGESTVDVSTLDFGWMEKLHAYDHWDILKNAPSAPKEPLDWSIAPVPDLLVPHTWAKLRLVHGLKTGQPVAAARDVRQLAWLMLRTDTYLGASVATALLRMERAAYESLPQPPAEWQPMSTQQIDRMLALVSTSIVFSNLSAPAEVARQARRCGETVTRCAALSESAFLAKYLSPLARDSHRDAYAALEEELAASPCHTSLVQTVWDKGMTIAQHTSEEGMPSQPKVLRKLPRWLFGRHIVGFTLVLTPSSVDKLKDFRKSLGKGQAQENR